ncbi:DUF2933 domain-containing protein [Streptomyces chartreusis]|uniref:DUF2933 domain-containing protein n=1 Tax=Streptomyces chartreusis TaxID=1969 RepID=UPI002799B07C|nr:DUF2933 domain-containing protein [Streptomyces moderatus]
MNDRRNYGMYALAAAAIVVVGTLFVGASLESLVWLALAAACPLMMFFMMRSMHGQGGMHSGPGEQGPVDRDEKNPRHHDDHRSGTGPT